MAKGWADFSAIGRALRNRNYAIYTAGIAFSHTGLWVQRLAVGWLSWSLTESAFWVGAVAAADLFPVVFIGPFAGVLADRINRLRLVFVCQALSAVQASVLFLLTAYDLITIDLLLLLTLVLGVISGLNQPARQSLVPSLVRAEDMTSAVALNSVVFNVARFTGPAIAGVVIAGYGVTPAFAINAVSFLCVLFALSRIRLPDQAEGRSRRRRRVLVDLLVGVRYVRGHRLIGPLLLMSLAMSLLVRPVNELLPAVSELLFAQGAAGLAMLTAARGVGALVAGLWLAKRGHVDGLVRNIVFSLLVASVSVFVLVGTGYFWIALLAFTAFGFAMSTGGVGSITMIQVAVDNRLRGRVLSLNGLTLRGLPAFGALLMGWVADRLGLVLPLSVAAGVCAVIFLIALRWEYKARDRIDSYLPK